MPEEEQGPSYEGSLNVAAGEEQKCSVAEEVASMVNGCGDNQLQSSFASLVTVLPSEAQSRIMGAVRGLLLAEGGKSLVDDAAGFALWKRVLGRSRPGAANVNPVVDAAAAPGKRPLRAMARPFQPQPPAKRPSLVGEKSELSGEVPNSGSDGRIEVESAAGTPAERPEGPGATVEERGGEDVTTMVTAAEVVAAAPGSAFRIFVTNIPFQVTELRLRTFLADKCPSAHFQAVELVRGAAGGFKGTAIVTCAAQTDLETALRLNGTVLDDRILTVRQYEERAALRHRGDRGAGKRTEKTERSAPGEKRTAAFSVIVKNLGFAAGEANLGELFAGCGVTAVRIARDRRSGRKKGFAVVELPTAQALQQALQRSGQEVCGRAVRVEEMRSGAAGSKEPVVDGEAAPASIDPEDEATAAVPEDTDLATAADKFAMAIDDLDALNDGGSPAQ